MTASPFLRPLMALPIVFALGVWAGQSLIPTGYFGATVSVPPVATDRPSASGPPGPEAAYPGPNVKNGRPDTVSIPDLSGLPPGEARKLLMAIKNPEIRAAAIRQCFASMPPEEWKGWIDGLGSGEMRRVSKVDFGALAERYTLINDIFAGIAAVDPVGFMAVQTSKGERNNDSEHESRLLVMRKWAETDPAAAMSFLTKHLAGGNAAPGLADSAAHMATVMVRNGRSGVLEWAAALPPEERVEATSAAISEMAATDPRAAATKLEALKDLPEMNSDKDKLNTRELAEVIASSLAWTNPSEAVAWAQAQSGDMRKKGLEGVLSGWAERDFDAALGAVKNLTPETQADGLSVLLGKSKPERIGELAQLVENQPESAARAEASAKVMSAWTHQNPEQASAWMARQPAGDVRDSAISTFVRWADVRDPEAGLIWAGSMSNADKRMEAINHIIEQLGPKAPAAVQPWLDTNPPITEAERAQIVGKFTQK
ncbi:MAG: hypothetical protein JWM59_1803 [Verrucomicrobiales bacterium]|nr:hypothetical protein [Verrucomicrobiales bacterium]